MFVEVFCLFVEVFVCLWRFCGFSGGFVCLWKFFVGFVFFFLFVYKNVYVQRSATRLKPMTAEINNIDHLVTMSCSAGKP